jgi:Spy/CpxP family protein refolding chaperone
MHSRHFRSWRSIRFQPAWSSGCGSEADPEEWALRAAARARRFAHRRFEDEELFASAGLGVRRPLRFLAFKLDLDEEQTGQLARVLERLKLERAQAALDLRRAAAELADALDSAEFARTRVDAASELRSAANRRVQEAVARTLEELHALLDAEQRAHLAELVRTGVIRI